MIENMVGKKYGRLKILKHYSERNSNGELRDFCDCICDCGNKKNHIFGKNIRRELTVSCGCYNYEKVYEACHKVNTYELLDDGTMVGFDSNGKNFLFDHEDYDKIKDFCWTVGNHGYASTRVYGRKNILFLHNFIMNTDENRTVDHKNRKRNDDTRKNLRFISISMNNINKERSKKNNTSGIIGVSKTENGTWHSFLSINGKRYSSYHKNFEEAVYSRLKMEKDFCGEFSPQIELFEEFGL